MTPANQPPQKAPPNIPFYPGHVMTRQHYERLAAEEAGQK